MLFFVDSKSMMFVIVFWGDHILRVIQVIQKVPMAFA